MKDKVRITFASTEALKMEMQERIISEGYGMRGKSQWISEAIERLFLINKFEELVYLNSEMKGFEQFDTITIEKSIKDKMERMVIEIRKIYPALEGVQSRILRTSILQRLLRP